MKDDLSVLGLAPAEHAAYRALVAQEPVAAEDLLTALVDKGLAALVDGRYVAVAPDIALEVLLANREKSLREAREHISTLKVAYRKHLTKPMPTLLEYVGGAAAVRQRIVQIQQAARSEVRRLIRSPQPPVELLADCRTIYEAAALPTDPPVDARVVPVLPLELYLLDDRLALVMLDEDRAAILQPCGLLDAYMQLFERLWERSLPAVPDEQEEARLLTSLLLSGLSDHAIARELGVSPRTAQRKLAAMLQDLGAHTRFQAGVQAAIRDL
ncbi:hypothetical protein [Kribbella sp. CA-293567]|uniref:hypothetical protein n=1 Tax=Kribbella sp. CA-293567 TaxID=3002436 RepID=UPI0022DD4C68|nr:hypothetical protein [Kribbella sp. CA-293567]WBQ07016.1 hypothetical protein OX958_09490 [Kribbella sp. CA-293567]